MRIFQSNQAVVIMFQSNQAVDGLMRIFQSNQAVVIIGYSLVVRLMRRREEKSQGLSSNIINKHRKQTGRTVNHSGEIGLFCITLDQMRSSDFLHFWVPVFRDCVFLF